MISLLLLPVLCLWYFYNQKSFVEEKGMDLGLPDKVSYAQLKKDFPILNQRNYEEFALNGSLETDKNNLAKFQKTLRHFNAVKDTVNGLKLQFGKKMNYEVFIRVLDILTIENTPTYVIWNNELLVVNGAPSDIEKERKRREAKYGKQTQMKCGTQDVINRQIALQLENQKAMEKEELQKTFFDNHWYLLLAYFTIVALNIFMLIKFNRNRIYNQKSYI